MNIIQYTEMIEDKVVEHYLILHLVFCHLLHRVFYLRLILSPLILPAWNAGVIPVNTKLIFSFILIFLSLVYAIPFCPQGLKFAHCGFAVLGSFQESNFREM
jgi:hypothetical protein